MQDKLLVYIAGPWVFRPNASEFQEAVRNNLKSTLWEPVFPVDPIPGVGSMDASYALGIHRHCVAQIDRCDAILAELSPWYGHMPDSGTVFEVGYAAAKGKQVVLWTTETKPLRERLILGGELGINDSKDKQGNYVEVFDFPLNAMLSAYPVFGNMEAACKHLSGLKTCDTVTEKQMEKTIESTHS